MTTKQLDDAAWKEYPCTWRNNRGAVKTAAGGYMRFGIPEPPSGRRELPEDLKGGDRIGWKTVLVTPEMVGQLVAVFCSIEIKGPGDKLKPGQKLWHNAVIEACGISEVWSADDGVIKERL